MEEVQNVIQLIISICTLIGLIGGLIPTAIVLFGKIKEVIKNKEWNTIVGVVKESMTAVENYAKQHPDMTSEDKLNMCLEGVKAACARLGVKLDDELINKIIATIKDLCSWSKTVNSK